MMPVSGQSAPGRGPVFASQDASQDRISRLEEQLRDLNARLLEPNK